MAQQLEVVVQMASSKQKDSFAPSALKGFLMLASVAVFVYVVAWLIVFGGSATAAEQLQLAPSAPEVPISETQQFLSYNHPDYNFTIQYPVGFLAQELSGGIASFRASAGVVGRISEVYEVIVDNSTSAESAYAAALQDARENAGENAGGNSETTTTVSSHRSKSGKFVRIIETTLPAEDYGTSDIKPEASTMLTGFYDCSGNPSRSGNSGYSGSSSYTAVVIGIVPKSLEADVGIAEHIIDTFKC